jgi:hypothetical protein
MNKTYQIYSRNNDINGNPFRLIILFHDGIIQPIAYESRSSSPNKTYELEQEGYTRAFRDIHLSPSEYKSIKKSYPITEIKPIN